MSSDDGSGIIYLHDNASYNGDRIAGGTAREVSTRIELDLAYSVEKVLNLELLVMQVAEKAGDYEILASGSDELLTESIENTFQFDILSGFLNSELKEIERFMLSLQLDIIDAYKKFNESDNNHVESLPKIKAKLHHAEESLSNSQELVAYMQKQSDKFEKLLASGISTEEDLENGNGSLMDSKWNLQSVEQQRYFLQSLEKSLAREMDLENRLSESRYNEKELTMKLHVAERDAYCSEDLIEVMMERVLAAENTVELLVGNSKEFMGKLQNDQFSSSTSTVREWEKSNMEKGIVKLSAEEANPEKSIANSFGPNGFPVFSEVDLKTNLKEVEYKCMADSSEISTLRIRVNVLEEQLRESETQLQFANASVKESNNHQNILYLKENNMENIINGLRAKVVEIQSRAESAEVRCTELMKANVELNDEVAFLINNGTEKANLERKLKESDMELEQANASVDANEEQKNMLYTAINDMEHIIEDLKGKVSKAENRAEVSEAKFALVADTSSELNEELSFLRGRLESLEASLHKADMAKVATAKDIGNRTRLIIELVKKLALEREHLQLQMSALTKRNKILTKRCLWSENDLCVNCEKAKNNNDHGNINSYDETLTESLSTSFQLDEAMTSAIFEMKRDPTVSAEDSLAAVPNVELVRTIEATQLNWKYICMAFIILLVSVLAVFLFQLENS